MKILFPTDFSANADQAQKEAIRLAHGLGGEIIVLHVTVDTPLYGEGLMNRKEVREVYEAARKWATSTLEERVAAIREHGLAARFLQKTGVPHAEIVEVAAAEGADYIVIGTRGRGGLERAFLGSVADRVIRTAPCPVVSIRQPED
jgi:nucleotide-binding universal stress UspA family protein